MRPISAEASRGYSHLTSGTSKGPSHPCCNSRSSPTYTSPLDRKNESSTHIQRSPVSPSELKRRDPFPAWSGKIFRHSRRISRGGALQKNGERNSRVVPHSQSPPDGSVHSRETCFPSTASTFKPRIDSHHGGTWDSPVEKPRGKASWEILEVKPLIP